MQSVPHASSGGLNSWQRRIFASAWITYFSYYLCRLNMPMAKSRLCAAYSWDTADFGLVLSALTLMYAVGQFVNGQLADRFGARAITTLGALGSVVLNLAVFVMTLTVVPARAGPNVILGLMIVLWGANGFFQSMGWPPIVRLMTHWFPAHNRGSVMGLLGTCYQLGAAFSWFLAFFLTGYFVDALGGDWRLVFAVPAVLFAVAGLVFFLVVRDSPEIAGVPGPDDHAPRPAETRAAPARTISGNVLATLSNPYLWIVAGTFFMLDVNRYGFVNWLPAYLDAHAGAQSVSLLGNLSAVMQRCIHPLAGSLGAIAAGWATDRFFGGRRAPVIALLLAALGLLSVAFPYIDPGQGWLIMIIVGLIGFCTYGPHILMVGHAAQDFGRKHGAAGAAGFIDALGYIGASLAGWGAGALIKAQGYSVTFVTFGSAALLGALLICVIWKIDPSAEREPVSAFPVMTVTPDDNQTPA